MMPEQKKKKTKGKPKKIRITKEYLAEIFKILLHISTRFAKFSGKDGAEHETVS